MIAGTGGYLKGYLEGTERPNYVEQKMLAPVTLGGVVLWVRPIRHAKNQPGVRVDIMV